MSFAVPRFRFAPSPNGLLHLGHALSALMNDRRAAACGGTMLLRFEDIDAARCRVAYETAIEADLRWLGLDWPTPVLRQSRRFPAYAEALGRLEAQGLLYPCFCSRGDIARAIAQRRDWPSDPDGSPLYPGTCRALPATERARRLADGSPHAKRLDVGKALAICPAGLDWRECREGDRPVNVSADPAAWGDVLLARKDVLASYHIAVVTDDAAQGISDVVRGADLFHATSLHRLLQVHLGFEAPTYHHHHLVRDEAGQKLSKSRNAPSLQALRHAGATPASVRHRLGF